MSIVQRIGTTAAVALISGAIYAGPTADATTLSLATCQAHYANTAAWADCTGGSEKSWARIAVKCRTGWKHSDWTRIDPGQRKTVRYECTMKASAAKAEVRKY